LARALYEKRQAAGYPGDLVRVQHEDSLHVQSSGPPRRARMRGCILHSLLRIGENV
jgi:hypothetical protein